VTCGVISSHKMNHQILKLASASIAPYLPKRLEERSERKVHRDSAGPDIDPVALPVARIENLLLKLERIQEREIALGRAKRQDGKAIWRQPCVSLQKTLPVSRRDRNDVARVS